MNFSKYKKSIIACVLALGIGVGGGYYFFGNPVTHQTTVREQTKQTKPITDTRNTYVVQAAKESGPAVVGITTQVFQKDIFNRTIYAGEGVGSGVLIDNDGHIVTNNHVVAGAKNGEVTVSLSDGSTVTGTVIGTDAQTDLAVVKINPPKNIQPIKIGDSDSLQVGEPAIAIGNPLGLEFKGSVTSGVISALARTIDDQGQRFPLIQTDAAINPGNSGGALINADGELIGINSSKISKEGVEGMGFAIPINSAMTVVDSIIKNGKVVRPYIGVWAVDRQTAARNNVSYEGEGLLIVQLDANGPAAQAGLVEGDTIAQIDGKDITKKKSRKVGGETRCKETENDTYCHAECPEDGNGGIFAHIFSLAQPLYSESRQNGKYGSRQKRGDTGIQPQPDTAEGGMSDATADEHQTACHNVGTYDAAGNAGKQTSQQGMPEESIM
jgi:serine protease Do